MCYARGRNPDRSDAAEPERYQPPGVTVWCLKHIPRRGSSLPFSPRMRGGCGSALTCGRDPPPATALFCVAKGKDIRGRGAAGAGAPGRRWATHGRGDALGCPSQGQGPGPGDILCSAGGRAPTEGGAGRGGPGAEPAGHNGRAQRGQRRRRWQQVPGPGKSRWRPCSSSTCPSCWGWPAPSTWTRTT